MKNVWKILYLAFFIFCLFLFKPRQDILFGAIDESQYIRLFEEGKDFVLCVDENNTFTGTYTITTDTVFLLYREHMGFSTMNRNTRPSDYNKILPKKLYINESASNIKSTDDNSFSAEIYIDLRQKSYDGTPNIIGELNSQKAHILAVGPRQPL